MILIKNNNWNELITNLLITHIYLFIKKITKFNQFEHIYHWPILFFLWTVNEDTIIDMSRRHWKILYLICFYWRQIRFYFDQQTEIIQIKKLIKVFIKIRSNVFVQPKTLQHYFKIRLWQKAFSSINIWQLLLQSKLMHTNNFNISLCQKWKCWNLAHTYNN